MLAQAAVKAVLSWKFQPLPSSVAKRGPVYAVALLECRSPRASGEFAAPCTEEARRIKFSGDAMVQLVVTPSGLPADVRIVRSPGHGLDEEAILAVKQWRFLPGMKKRKASSPARYGGRYIPYPLKTPLTDLRY